jgi:hypothetical protein
MSNKKTQISYDVKPRPSRKAIIAAEEQWVLHTLSVRR